MSRTWTDGVMCRAAVRAANAVELQMRDLTARAMTLRAETIDEKTRSVEALVSTENPVTVFDFRTFSVIEEVLRSEGAELPEQVPLLESHNRYSVDAVFGSARGPRRVPEGISTRLFFAEGDPEVERSWNKVRQGHLRDVSIGYRSVDYTDIPPNKTRTVAGQQYTAGDRPLRVTTRWQLKEVSLVAIGADPAAKIRSQGENQMPKNLREYLESIGLRSEASDAEAWEFFSHLETDRAERARSLLAEPADGQRSEPKDPAPPPAEPKDPAQAQRSEPKDPAPPRDPDEAAREAVQLERKRSADIRRLAGDDVDPALCQRALDEGWDNARASAEFLADVRKARRAPLEGGPAIHSRSHDADVNVRSLAAGMLMGHGFDPTKHSLRDHKGEARSTDRLTEQDADRGRQLSRLSAVDICRECVLLESGRQIRDPEEAFRAAVSGGALSHVFSTNIYARLTAGWEEAGDTTTGWCDEEDVPNFLQQEDISLDADARLRRLPRADTAKHATASDTHETYKIARYAAQFVVDEQDVIDDRLGAIMRMPEAMGRAARALRPDLVYSIMLENPALVADTGAVFNATAVTTAGGHANLGTAALSSAALKAAISAMVQQRIGRTGTDPGRALTIRPRFLIVPAALEWTARELTAAAALAKLFADSSDPFYAQLNLLAQEGLRVVIDDRVGAIGVMDPRTQVARTGLDTNWFLTAGGTKGLRVAYLRGAGRAPQMRSFVLDRGQWGLGWDIKHDIGAAFMDYRPWYKSTGAA